MATTSSPRANVVTLAPLPTTTPERSKPRITGGSRPKKFSSASLYSSGLSDELSTRMSTWSGAGSGTGTFTSTSGKPSRVFV
jgi:hypothetical protein